MSDDSGSDSDGLIWDFGKPTIPEHLKGKIVEMKKSTRKKKNVKLWPSPHSIKVAVDESRKNRPETPPQVVNVPSLEALRAQIKLFRQRLDMIAQGNITTETEDNSSIRNLEHAASNSPPHKKVRAKCDASMLNDSLDEDSLALCSQLVEDRFVNQQASYDNLANRCGTSCTSNEVTINSVIEKSPEEGFKPKVARPSIVSSLLDDDDDLFLNESLSSY